jgi:hypothetical protein
MDQEIVLILIFAVTIAAYGMIRRAKEKRHEEAVARVIQCEVTYRDSVATQAFLETFFASNLVDVLNVNCFLESGEDEDLYTNVYKLYLPGNLTAAQLVVKLSQCETVQSVHTKTE